MMFLINFTDELYLLFHNNKEFPPESVFWCIGFCRICSFYISYAYKFFIINNLLNSFQLLLQIKYIIARSAINYVAKACTYVAFLV